MSKSCFHLAQGICYLTLEYSCGSSSLFAYHNAAVRKLTVCACYEFVSECGALCACVFAVSMCAVCVCHGICVRCVRQRVGCVCVCVSLLCVLCDMCALCTIV